MARLSYASDGEPAKNGRYRLQLQPRHLGPEVYVTLVDKGLWGELLLTREEGSIDFTTRDLDFIGRIVPLVGAGLRAGALRAGAAIVTEHDASDTPGVQILDRGGRIVSATPNVGAFLVNLGAGDRSNV